MENAPIRLGHINLAYKSIEYHKQPKLFLSLRDTFYYILRHDKYRCAQGKMLTSV